MRRDVVICSGFGVFILALVASAVAGCVFDYVPGAVAAAVVSAVGLAAGITGRFAMKPTPK
jgi:hypothetical protein